MNVKVYSRSDFPAYLPKLNLLYDDLFSGGKGFRSKLVQKISIPLGLSAELQQLLCQTIEFIHNASLLHDDLIDGSPLRRGKTAAWAKYTPEYAVLAGDYLLARVMVNLSGHGNIRLVQYTAEVISDLLEGEWLQDSVVGDFFVTMDQLDRIHNLKTASLFKWCIRAPFIAANRNESALHESLEEAGTILGQLFQRGDDLLDYDVRNDEGKEILGDLKAGYLNSFGAYLSKGLSRPQIDQLIKSKDLKDFKIALAGDSDLAKAEKHFQMKLAEFDAVNTQMIALYKHHIEQLRNILPAEQHSIIKDLLSLPELLYWRKQGPTPQSGN